jgi:hypothetical protein
MFSSPLRRLDLRQSRRPSLLTHVVLPALTEVYFDREYLEEIISRIDVPLLRHIVIKSFDQS